jgi:FkbM family methyltransferase
LQKVLAVTRPSGAIPVFPIVETRFGRMHVLQGDTVIGRSLRLYGEFAGDEVDSILSLVGPGDHVLDLGANIGVHSLALARKVGPSGQVIAVEPQRYPFQLLCANVTMNQLTTVHCLRAAVGDEVSTCEVPVLDPRSAHNAGATEVTVAGSGSGESDRVALITVDALNLSRCNLIKVDTEGFEDRVIAGARTTIETLRPALYVEVHDREKLRLLVAVLRPFGYQLALHHTHFYRSANPQGEGAQIFAPKAGGSALVALPEDRARPEGWPGRLDMLA